jgi:cytochrome c peroxidase
MLRDAPFLGVLYSGSQESRSAVDMPGMHAFASARRLLSSTTLIIVLCSAGAAAAKHSPPAPPPGVALPSFVPIPARVELDARKVALGKRLFSDGQLSKDGRVSCASCHDLSHGGMDGRKVSVGVGGALGSINAPTVLNSAYNFRQFWDGRAGTLEAQIDGPIQNPAEMASDWDSIIKKLAANAAYVRAFAIYPDGITPTNIRDAIATFERALITPDAPFDRFLRGQESALSSEEQAGYDLFVSLGCAECHAGINLGGSSFQRFGRIGMQPFLRPGRAVTKADLGRYSLTKNESDLYRFKVPTLRNVALTAPYFHDGSAANLREAIVTMAQVQLGTILAKDDVDLLARFLGTLTGQPPRAAAGAPAPAAQPARRRQGRHVLRH